MPSTTSFRLKDKLLLTGLVLAVVAAFWQVWFYSSRRASHAGTTHLVVTGENGALLMGFYVQEGWRVAISNAVPWTVSVPRLTELEFRKARPAKSVVVDLRYEESNGPEAGIREVLPAGVAGIRVQVRNGLVTRTF
jgi:hypothetical protein